MGYFKLNKFNGEAQQISDYMWELVRPLATRNPADVTTSLVAVIKHPTTSEEALVLSDNPEEIQIHTDNDDAHIDTMTQALETAGVLDVVEKATLRAALKGNKGKSIPIRALIPARYTEQERAALEAEGWFPGE